MKKTMIIAFLLGVLTAQAQEELKIGAFAAYGSEIKNKGVGANAAISILKNLSIAPAVIYYFPREEYGVKWSWLEVNANANYFLVNQKHIGVYALGGLNYSSVKVSYEERFGMGRSSYATDGEVGPNLGAGVNFNPHGKITPSPELKYVLIEGRAIGCCSRYKIQRNITFL